MLALEEPRDRVVAGGTRTINVTGAREAHEGRM